VHLLAPDPWQISERDASVDDVLLELEAQDDVHAVGHLVGLDPDQRRLHTVDSSQKDVQLQRVQLIRERLLATLVEETPELAAPSDEVLPEPALRFVDAQ